MGKGEGEERKGGTGEVRGRVSRQSVPDQIDESAVLALTPYMLLIVFDRPRRSHRGE